MISGRRVEGLCCVLVGLAADEATEEGGDDGLRDDKFIIDRAAFETEELHTYGLCRKDMD